MPGGTDAKAAADIASARTCSRSGLLPAGFPLGVKWFDSRTVRRMRHSAVRAASRRSHDAGENAAMGQAGMPDAIRITVEGFGAHPQHEARSRASIAGEDGACNALADAPRPGTRRARHALCRPCRCTSHAPRKRRVDRNSRHSRRMSRRCCRSIGTRSRRSRSRSAFSASRSSPRSCSCAPVAGSPRLEASARDESAASKAAIDRAYALLLSEPQILVAWAAARDEPEIIGDPTLVTAADTPQRVLAFGTWLEPETAGEMERSVDALRARGDALRHDDDHARRPHHRGRGPGRSAAAPSCGCARSAASSTNSPSSPRATRSSSKTPPPCAP